MTCHQDKGWGFSLPSLLFPLNLMKKRDLWRNPSFRPRNAAALPNEGWSLFRSLEKSPAEKGQNPQVKESTAPRDAPSAAPDSPASREPWMCLGRVLSSCADVLGALEIAILGSRGGKKKKAFISPIGSIAMVLWAGQVSAQSHSLVSKTELGKTRGRAVQHSLTSFWG